MIHSRCEPVDTFKWHTKVDWVDYHRKPVASCHRTIGRHWKRHSWASQPVVGKPMLKQISDWNSIPHHLAALPHQAPSFQNFHGGNCAWRLNFTNRSLTWQPRWRIFRIENASEITPAGSVATEIGLQLSILKRGTTPKTWIKGMREEISEDLMGSYAQPFGILRGPVRGAVIGWYRVLRTAAQQSMEDI